MTVARVTEGSATTVPGSKDTRLHGDVFLVLERTADGPAPPAAQGLLVEGARLAGRLGVRAATVEIAAPLPDNLRTTADALVELLLPVRPRILLMVDGDSGRQLAPLVACGLATASLLGCTGVTAKGGAVVFHQPAGGGWFENEVSFAPEVTAVVTLDAGVLAESPHVARRDAPAAAGREAMPPVVASLELSVPADPACRRRALLPPDFRTVDLIHAPRVLAAGMGSASPEVLAQVDELAELLEASLGTTRPMVDEGRFAKDRLIGQTGRTVKPELYVSLGVSGSPHHLAGVQAGRLLAINKDARAPVFQYTDSGYLGDLAAVLPGLIRRIKEWRDGLEA
jgi:electron transfer flavoprotein alpha subunit